MYLKSISIKNYRGLESLYIPFGGKSVVIYGANGTGKSSVLSGVSLLLESLISDLVVGGRQQKIEVPKCDIRSGASQVVLRGRFMLEDGSPCDHELHFSKGAGILRQEGIQLGELPGTTASHSSGPPAALPVFAYYGSNRTVSDAPIERLEGDSCTLTEAYRGSLSAKTSFEDFFSWFHNQEKLENARKVELQDLTYKEPELEAVRTTISEVLQSLSNLRITRSPTRLCATKNRETLSLEQLSDGERCLLATVGDLTRRLAIANPEAENPLLGRGIVLIDEVELHLHPAWQRTIAPTLQKAFPNIQLIMTTNSPLVLGGLDENFKIFGLFHNNGDLVRAKEMPVGQYDANLVLENYMGTPCVSPEISELESRIFSLIEAREFEAAKTEIERLAALTRGTDDTITKARVMMRRRSAQKT